MQDNYSDQASHFASVQNEQKDDSAALGDENSASESALNEIEFRGVMSQYEMEILRKLFPKCAQTLAEVLRNRPRPLSHEL